MKSFLYPKSIYLIICFSLLMCSKVKGQGFILDVEPDSLKTEAYFDLEQPFFEREQLESHLEEKKDSLIEQGFLLASVDKVEVKDSVVSVEVYLGSRVNSIEILQQKDSLDYKFEPKQFQNWASVQAFKKEVVEYYTERGFLDTTVGLNQLSQSKSRFQATLDIQKGRQYKLDTIYLQGDLELSYRYLLRYFNIQKGEVVTSRLIDKLKTRGKQSELFEVIEEPKIQINEWGTASIHLNLKEKKANAFDLLVGLLPNASTSAQEKQLLVTGQGKLRLMNPFGEGREFEMDYRQLQPQSPLIKVSTFIPSVFRQRFGLRGNFDLTKQDSSFVNLNFKLGANYQINEKSHLVLSAHSLRSYLQKVDTSRVVQTKMLPESLDFNKSLYSAEYVYSKLDRSIATRKGVKINGDFGVGVFRLQPNSAILNLDKTNFDYKSLYHGLLKPLPIYESNLDVQYFLPLGQVSTLLYQNKSGAKWNQFYTNNDLYRLGGVNSIRGFDEMSYYASQFTMNTLEYRLLLSRDSFFSVFSDFGYLENRKQKQENLLLGIGSGLNLSTKAGIFTIDLAVGRDKHNPFDFSQSRIHFGYINVF